MNGAVPITPGSSAPAPVPPGAPALASAIAAPAFGTSVASGAVPARPAEPRPGGEPGAGSGGGSGSGSGDGSGSGSGGGTGGHRFHRPGWVTQLGLRATAWWADGRCTLEFLGEVLAAFGRLLRGRSMMRRSDLFWQLEQTGPRSLPIVSLTCFLVGLILAYMGAAQLQRFGAQIYIADLVTVGVVREIAALMTGVILSGRIGAAFAAQLGSMQANEEIDALKAMGVPPMDFLVMPRLLAMLLVAPLLTAYAALVGMLAGLLVATGIFGVQPLEYLHQSLEAMSLTHLNIGLLKGTVYAALVALAGCRQGLYAGRSAQAVGEATTAAVVQALVWIVVAASALTISFQRLDW